MDDERLIELVRKSPLLYDMSIEEYNDNEAKTKVWKDIAKELKTNAALCKARWSNIRNNFKKSLLKKETVSRQNGQCIQQYKYAALLKFVKPFFGKKPYQCVENDPKLELSDDNSTTEDNEGNECPRMKTEHSSDCTTENNEGNESPASDKKMTHSPNCTTEAKEGNESPTPRKKMKHSSNSTTEDNKGNECPPPRKKMTHSLNRTTEDNKGNACPTSRKKMRHSFTKSDPPKPATAMTEKLTKTPQKEHPVDAFLKSLSLPLKSLTPLKFNAAKTQLFAIVQEFEREMLQSDH